MPNFVADIMLSNN